MSREVALLHWHHEKEEKKVSNGDWRNLTMAIMSFGLATGLKSWMFHNQSPNETYVDDKQKTVFPYYTAFGIFRSKLMKPKIKKVSVKN